LSSKKRYCPAGNELLPRMYWKRDAYYYVRKRKWRKLSPDYAAALRHYIAFETPASDWTDIVDAVYQTLEHRRKINDLAANTLDQYQRIRPRVTQAFDKPIDQITTRDIMRFLDQYERTPNMANRTLSVLRLCFDKALRLGATENNPALAVKRYPERKRTRYITDEEVYRLREHATPKMRAIIDLCYFTGQRIGDILSMTWEQVTEDGILITQQKTGHRLMVQMTPDIQAALDALKAPRRYVVTARGKSTPMGYMAARDRFRRLCALAGVEDASLHDLRAKSLTDLKRQGGNPQALAGHSLESTTLRYIRDRETAIVSGPCLADVRQTGRKTA